MNDAAILWEDMKNNYFRWKKDNYAPGAFGTFVNDSIKLIELIDGNPFVSKKETKVEMNANVAPVENERTVVTAVVENVAMDNKTKNKVDKYINKHNK